MDKDDIRYCHFGDPPVEADNDCHAPTTDDPWWQESALFAWGDPRRGAGGWLRLAIHPNQKVANAYVWIVVRGKTVYRRQFTEQPLPASGLFDCTIAGCSIKTLQPMMAYALTVEAEALSLRVRWENFHWPLSMSLNVGAATLAAGHYNMMGQAVGEVVWRGEAFEVRGSGFSDHSWGVRRQHLPASRSYFCVFDREFYLMALPVLAADGSRHLLGYVRCDGRLGRLGTDSRFGYSMRDDWITVAGCDSTFYDEFDRAFHITGKTVSDSSTWAMGHGKLVHHAIARFECGGRIGGGILEVSHPKRMRPDQIAESGLDPDGWWLNEH